MKKITYAIAFSVALIVAKVQAQTFLKGEIKGPFEWKSSIYPGTERNYWIYVPQQYDASKPACTMIVQDGLSRANDWKLTPVLDSLIALKEIPVIIGIFVDHGKVPATGTDNYPRYNRSFEYDALGDRYARFLLEELLPEVSKTYNLSKDPSDRSIAGASSGAICAFNAAWEKPNEFRRVLSTIGTYVGLRGGDEFPTLVRKTEPKPLRVFLEDGKNDLNIYAGDWWTANQAMLSALTWAGYEVHHVWGEGGHNGAGGRAVMPEALKWLWKDYPKPVSTHPGPVQRFNPVLENEGWKEIPTGSLAPYALAINKKGEVFFSSDAGVYRVAEDNISIFAELKGKARGISFGPEGNLYVSDAIEEVVLSLDEKGKGHEVSKINADFLIVSNKGIYFGKRLWNELGYFSFSKKTIIKVKIPSPSVVAIALNSEQTFLNVTDPAPIGYSLKINEDGTLSDLQEYGQYHIPYGLYPNWASGMTVDTESRLYTATHLGIQITDQLGRVNFILDKPAGQITDLKFGGADFTTLYAIVNKKLYSRKISTKGVLPFLPPVKPPKPGL